MQNKTLFHLNLFDLQRFADGGGTGDGGATGATAGDAGQQSGDDLSVMRYGKQEEPAAAEPEQAEEPAQQPKKDPDAEFDQLVKGEYKAQFDARVQEILQKRFRAQEKDLQAYRDLAPTLEMLGKKYGVKSGDIQALNKAIEDDDAYYEAEAFAKGIPVAEYKAVKKVERENETLKAELEAVQRQQDVDKIFAEWREQAKALKAVYPAFDLQSELKNPMFAELLKNRYVNMQTAYEVVHKDEIIPAAMQVATKKAEQKIANKIRSGGNRPKENGMGAQGASLVKSDVSQLSKADIAEINRRVAQGERIVF